MDKLNNDKAHCDKDDDETWVTSPEKRLEQLIKERDVLGGKRGHLDIYRETDHPSTESSPHNDDDDETWVTSPEMRLEQLEKERYQLDRKSGHLTTSLGNRHELLREGDNLKAGLTCELCYVTTSDNDLMDQHLMGRSHLSNVEKHENKYKGDQEFKEKASDHLELKHCSREKLISDEIGASVIEITEKGVNLKVAEVEMNNLSVEKQENKCKVDKEFKDEFIFHNEIEKASDQVELKNGSREKLINDEIGASVVKITEKKGCFKCGEEGHMSRDCPTGGGGGGDGGACRKCGEEGHFAKDCSLPDKCFKCKKEGHMSADCELPDTCFKCKKEGHMAADCELPDTCRKCKKEGHMAKDCELPDVCRNCGEEGHMSKDCSKPQLCKRCGEEGHMVRECTQEEKTRQMTDEEGKIREIYVPKEEDDSKLFESAITSGINFSKFDSIPVQVTGENPPSAIKSFSSAGLRPLLLENIEKSGYKVPTPVQKRCLPIVMSGRDLMSCAQTGSGKTAAFLLPILHKLMESQADNHAGEMVQAPQALVITPTRELAMQIKDEARKFSMGSMMKCVVAYGGTSVGYQLTQLQKGCNVLIATPGRLMDFVDKGKVSFENLKYLVLDEADRMLDMGFMPDIERCVGASTMPPKGERQTLMFSATFPDEIQTTAQEFLIESYLFVTVGVVGGACADVVQEFHEVTKYEKREKLTEILGECDPKDKTLVFVQTKKNADFIATHLSGEGLPTTSIHGDRFQREREEALYDFRTGAMPILVATAVAARGLDIKGVAHVVNFDMPEDIDEYVHRIGRTGRVGNVGKATSFYDGEENSGIAGPLVKILTECGQQVPDWLAEAATNVPSGGEKSGGGDAAADGDDDEDWG